LRPGPLSFSFLLSFRSPTEGMAERREAVSFILSRA
jgi:hypothetical protein